MFDKLPLENILILEKLFVCLLSLVLCVSQTMSLNNLQLPVSFYEDFLSGKYIHSDMLFNNTISQ